MCAIAALFADLFQPVEQLVLAVEAAVRVVLQVIGILELVRRDQLVPDAELRAKSIGVALVRLGNGSRIGRDGDGVLAQHLLRRPGQIGRVRPAGIGHDHLAHVPQNGEQLAAVLPWLP